VDVENSEALHPRITTSEELKMKKDRIREFIKWAKQHTNEIISISGPKLAEKFGISKTTANRIKAEFNIRTKGRIKSKVQFCPRKHDTFVTGRDRHLRCIECVKIDHPLKRGAQSKQICSNGHNKDLVGRAKDGHCKSCVSTDRKQHYKRNRRRIIKRVTQYIKNHPAIRRLASIRVNVKRKLRIPKFGQEDIYEFYNNCPSKKTIDHIIPLCGKKVSGLHVRWNLQYLSGSQNSSKNNRVNLVKISKRYGKLLEKLGLKDLKKFKENKNGHSR
jgi:hypothetical protein